MSARKSNAWDFVDNLEEFKVLLQGIEEERRIMKLLAYQGNDFSAIYYAANRQRDNIEKLDALVHQIYKKALKEARK